MRYTIPQTQPKKETPNPMSKLVCRMAKVKKNDIRGYQIHNLRELKSNTNPDIDPTRSYLNKDFINDQPINFKKKWEERIKEGYTLKREIRGDATRYNEFIIGSDKEFFDKLDQAEKDRFFKTATDFFTERYGKENVLYSIAHYDELRGAAAHAHVAVVPLKDGKLTGKEVFDRKELRYLQEELPKALQRAGFYIERGRKGSKAQHIETATFKMMKAEEAEKLAIDETKYAQQHLDLLNEEIEVKTAALDKIEEIESVEYQEKRTWYGKKTDHVVVDHADFDQIKKLAEDHEKLKTELVHADQEYRTLQEKYVDLEKEKDRYADQNHKLGVELLRHKTEVNALVDKKIDKNRRDIYGKIQEKEKENDFLVQELKLAKDYISSLEREVNERDKEIVRLKDQVDLLQQRLKDFREVVQVKTRELIQEAVGYARKSFELATKEWLSRNAKEVLYAFASDKKQINKRSSELYKSFVEEADRKEHSKGDGLER